MYIYCLKPAMYIRHFKIIWNSSLNKKLNTFYILEWLSLTIKQEVVKLNIFYYQNQNHKCTAIELLSSCTLIRRYFQYAVVLLRPFVISLATTAQLSPTNDRDDLLM